MIHGIDVVLYVENQIGTDAFNAPVFEEIPTVVRNVIVGEPSAEDIVNDLQLYGKRIAYTLGIPKGDDHDWECGGGVFRSEIPHLWRRDTGDRGYDPTAMEQKGQGGTLWRN